jgi:ribosomal protein L34
MASAIRAVIASRLRMNAAFIGRQSASAGLSRLQGCHENPIRPAGAPSGCEPAWCRTACTCSAALTSPSSEARGGGVRSRPKAAAGSAILQLRTPYGRSRLS